MTRALPLLGHASHLLPVRILGFALLAFLVVFVLPVVVAATLYWAGGGNANWRTANRASAGLLPPARQHPAALVRILSARTVSWRGIVASHAWVVIKDAGAPVYQRFDYTAWGEPIAIDRFVADGLWFGSKPIVVAAADGAEAAAMIPAIRETVRSYPYFRIGDYRAWPGPNSNTFVAAVIAAVPALQATLPPTAIGKDFPFDKHWLGLTPSGTGVRINAGGYLGLTIGWIEGIEVNVLGAVAGFDLRRPALKLPAFGRLGMAAG